MGKRFTVILWIVIVLSVRPAFADAASHSQWGLLYQGKPTAYGCAPAAIAYLEGLVADGRQVMGAQELLDRNAAQGQFTSRGMDPFDTRDELAPLGYQPALFWNTPPESGPFLAVVYLHGGNHSVVVHGLGDLVTFWDPWTGCDRTVSREWLESIWHCRCGMTI